MEIKIYQGHVIEEMKKIEDESIDCVISSPPYWQMRDYGLPDYVWGGNSDGVHWFDDDTKKCICGAWKGQLGLEKDYNEYIQHLMLVMDEVKRVLKPEGTVWINLGDTYQKKSLVLIPHRFALACAENGWIIRNDIIWAKKDGRPESAQDRFSRKHEHIIFMTKQLKYYFNLDSIRDPLSVAGIKRLRCPTLHQDPNGPYSKEGFSKMYMPENAEALIRRGKNPGDIIDFWDISTAGKANNHYATFNPDVIKKPIVAGCKEGGTVLDIFAGTGTTLVQAMKYGRNAIGIEAKPEYVEIIKQTTAKYKGDALW